MSRLRWCRRGAGVRGGDAQTGVGAIAPFGALDGVAGFRGLASLTHGYMRAPLRGVGLLGSRVRGAAVFTHSDWGRRYRPVRGCCWDGLSSVGSLRSPTATRGRPIRGVGLLGSRVRGVAVFTCGYVRAPHSGRGIVGILCAWVAVFTCGYVRALCSGRGQDYAAPDGAGRQGGVVSSGWRPGLGSSAGRGGLFSGKWVRCDREARGFEISDLRGADAWGWRGEGEGIRDLVEEADSCA